MKRPSEYPPASPVALTEKTNYHVKGETLWHRAFFAAIMGKSTMRISSEETVDFARRIADAAMAEIDRREKGEA